MNINCPHCSAYLTVPEQYAGQLMKCPKCNSNFTVPALPAIDHEPAFAMAQSPPAPAPSSAADPVHADAGRAGRPRGGRLQPRRPSRPSRPARRARRPRFRPRPPPSSIPSPRRVRASTPSPASPARAGHGHADVRAAPDVFCACSGSRSASLVLLFFVQLFPWVGIYPGGVPVVTQSA